MWITFLSVLASAASPPSPPLVVELVSSADVDAAGYARAPGLKALAQQHEIIRFERLFPASATRRDPEAFAALGLDRFVRLELRPGASPQGALAGLTGGSAVRGAWVDSVGQGGASVDDPFFDVQWSLHNDGSFSDDGVPGADIGALEAWETLSTLDVPEIIVAVLDTGLALTEPDIAGRLWTNAGEIAGNGVDDDANGYVDDVDGWDFAYEDGDPTDGYGHGSNVTGIIAAERGNGIGYAGVCDACRIMPLKNLNDENWGYYSWWAESIVYAVDQGASVLNMSEYGSGTDAALLAAVEYAHANGVVVVACSGNTDSDLIGYPAGYDTTISVGATDDSDRRASPFGWGGGSSYGVTLDLVAPGDTVYGLAPNPGVYDWFWSGTSQATPHVAGVAAIVMAIEPSLSPDEVRRLLGDTAVDLVGRAEEDTPGWDIHHGWGRLDAAAAVRQALAVDDDLDGDGQSWRDGDCDDDDPTVYAGADELCDEIDQDCDGDVVGAFPDDDGDGWPECGDGDGDGWLIPDDCDDADPDVHPDATDTPGDGVDQDCTGADAMPCFADDDGDGYGASSVPADDCDDAGLVAADGDCDDGDGEVYPGAPEACGTDADCDGVVTPCEEEKAKGCG